MQDNTSQSVSFPSNLLITGFIQVFFVAVNTYLIAKSLYLGILLCGFTISFIWSWNVRKVVFGSIEDRLYYSSGAAIGSVTGAFLIKMLVG